MKRTATGKSAPSQTPVPQKRKQIMLSLDLDILEAIESRASEVRLPRNVLLQQAVLEHLKKNDCWPPKNKLR